MNRASTLATSALLVVLLASAAITGCVADDPDAVPKPSVTTSPGRTDRTDGTDVRPVSTGPRTGGFGSSRLAFFQSCPDLLGYLQEQSLDRVSAWGLGGGPFAWDERAMPMTGDMKTASTEAPAAMGDSAGGFSSSATTAPVYSGTNTQEVGVDEGDIVETNGEQVFVAGQDGVRIIDVDGATVIATLRVPQGSHQLILDGDRLLVVTTSWSGREETVTSLYDVADPSNPVLQRRSHLEGRVVAVRSIDGTARLVLSSALATRLAFVFPDQFGLDEERALEANRAVITESDIDDWMPRMFDEQGDGSFGEMTTSLDCATVAAPRDFAGLGISWIASIDLDGDAAPLGAAGVVSNGDLVYASTDALYLATVPWDWYHPANGAASKPGVPPTSIHQFSLGADGAASYVASGEVPGRLLNQFSMSALGGDLRVAVTNDGWQTNTESESSVHVLRPDGTDLVEIGSVGGLGKTEQIFAVRFMGTQAYVVTFRQTDPLYVIDLADPTNPVVTGELKIPGYSAYLHPVGDGLLLGVGQDADLSGRTTGTQLALFDVSDPADPQQLSKLLIGGYSEAEWDHKAFLYWPEDGTIAIPTSPMWNACPADTTCLADQVTSAGGGVVVAQLQGTELVGRGTIQHDVQGGSGCWNPLQRSMIIDSEIVTVGFDQVKFTDRATLEGRAQASWGNPEQYGCMYWMEG